MAKKQTTTGIVLSDPAIALYLIEFSYSVLRHKVWDPDTLADTSPGSLHHKHKMTPYEGMELKGRVKATIVGGQQVRLSEDGLLAGALTSLTSARGSCVHAGVS